MSTRDFWSVRTPPKRAVQYEAFVRTATSKRVILKLTSNERAKKKTPKNLKCMFLHFVILELRDLPLFSRSNVENISTKHCGPLLHPSCITSFSLGSFKPSPEVNLLQSDWQRPHQYLTVFSLLPWSTICLFQANCSVMKWRGIVLILTRPWSDYVERKITFIFLFYQISVRKLNFTKHNLRGIILAFNEWFSLLTLRN